MDERDRTWLEEMSEAYERWLVPTLFAPFAADLAERVAALGPRRILELAAGTGVVTRAVLERTDAELTATDLNEGMIAVGRRNAEAATWRQADALDLPFDDDSFDLVVCQFGVMFFPDKRAAFAEARRVLAPGGTFLFNVWGSVAESDFAEAMASALAAVLDEPPAFMAAVPHGYHHRATVVSDLEAAGFHDVQHVAVTLTGSAASATDLAAGFCRGTPIGAALAEHGDLDELVTRIGLEVTATFGTGPVSGSMTAYVFEAAA
jgi:SAM-dependent methyltransferase